MFRFKRGFVLVGVVALVVLVTLLAPQMISGLDNKLGSYVMVAVAVVAAGIWLARRRQ